MSTSKPTPTHPRNRPAVGVGLNDAEKALIQRAADREGLPLAAFIRSAALKEARAALEGEPLEK